MFRKGVSANQMLGKGASMSDILEVSGLEVPTIRAAMSVASKMDNDADRFAMWFDQLKPERGAVEKNWEYVVSVLASDDESSDADSPALAAKARECARIIASRARRNGPEHGDWNESQRLKSWMWKNLPPVQHVDEENFFVATRCVYCGTDAHSAYLTYQFVDGFPLPYCSDCEPESSSSPVWSVVARNLRDYAAECLAIADAARIGIHEID